MNKLKNKNALVIRPGSLGDLIATIPVFTSLKNNLFNVYLVGNEKVNKFLEQKRIIEKGIGFGDIRLAEFFSQKKAFKISEFPEFDIVIAYIEKEDNLSQNLYLTYGDKVISYPVPEILECQITEFLLSPVKKLGLKVFYPQTSSKGSKEILFIHPGSGSKKKNWEKENFFEVFNYFRNKIDCKIILGECEISDYDYWKKFAGKENIVVPENIIKLAEIIESGRYFLGNDSGVSHLAAFLGLKSFIIFGPTDPKIWAPKGSNVSIFKAEIECSPCKTEKRKTCKNNICLQEVKPQHIISIIEKQLKKGGESNK